MLFPWVVLCCLCGQMWNTAQLCLLCKFTKGVGPWGGLCHRYWKPFHFEGLALVESALREVCGSQPPTLTSAALRWLYHHSKLQVRGPCRAGGGVRWVPQDLGRECQPAAPSGERKGQRPSLCPPPPG